MLDAPYATLDPGQATVELAASRAMYPMLAAGEYPNTAAVCTPLHDSPWGAVRLRPGPVSWTASTLPATYVAAR